MGSSDRSGVARIVLGSVRILPALLCFAFCLAAPSSWAVAEPVTAGANAPRLPFRHEDGGFGKNLVVVAVFLAALSLAAYLLIRYGRGRFGNRAITRSAPLTQVLEARRVTPKLSIYKLRLASGRETTIADNGNTLLLLETREPDDPRSPGKTDVTHE